MILSVAAAVSMITEPTKYKKETMELAASHTVISGGCTSGFMTLFKSCLRTWCTWYGLTADSELDRSWLKLTLCKSVLAAGIVSNVSGADAHRT